MIQGGRNSPNIIVRSCFLVYFDTLDYDWLVGIVLVKANGIKLIKYTFALTDCTLFGTTIATYAVVSTVEK